MSRPAINPRFTQARRRAQRLDAATSHPGLSVPAYQRRTMTPRVEIGVLRDPALLIMLSPAIHLPERTRRFDRYDAVGVLALAGFVALMFVGV
ncbi:hypothetical protein [uncultured Castellaniella sp.]|uniref:hypothetical protein n=1 Tax=uncultured Castellaniella sp. TaxID=647907 RepID=UPI002628CC07|nr:hypothetical protein [uncultured Castellaniella sp.]